MVCMTELGFGLGPKRPCQHIGPDLTQLSYGKKLVHICAFLIENLSFVLKKVMIYPISRH
jgi:hypothetical protein